jgi:hypothetical protein
MSYGSFDLQSNNINASIKENLAKELGLKYSGERKQGFLIFSSYTHKNNNMTQMGIYMPKIPFNPF